MCYDNCTALNALRSLRGAAHGAGAAAVRRRVVAWLVRPPVQPARPLAAVAPACRIERSFPARYRALREAEMESRRRRDRSCAGEAVLPADPFQAADAEAAQGLGRRAALRASRHAAAGYGARAACRARSVGDRLDQCTPGAALRRTVSPRRLRRLRAREIGRAHV